MVLFFDMGGKGGIDPPSLRFDAARALKRSPGGRASIELGQGRKQDRMTGWGWGGATNALGQGREGCQGGKGSLGEK